MHLEEAKKILSETIRSELRDHAFGDVEIFWEKDGKELATGYFGGPNAGVTVNDQFETGHHFNGEDARALRFCGTEGKVDRNDETGPDAYSEGITMPGLTKEGVLKELTGGE